MVALGFSEFGLWGEALAVTEEGTVAVGLEAVGEFSKAEDLSFVFIIIWPITE